MAELKFLTRGGSDPSGKPKVYFACHPDDFKLYFDSVCNDILKYSNCAICYYDPEDTVVPDEDFYMDLCGMQLFVMPVTTKLLVSENRALDVEFRLAQETDIPVLPLMQESRLEELFNRRCGDIQFLEKNSSDVTAISYEKKLENYLSSMLVDDELAEEIRNSFDARIFLSYRKKDRKHAQELMRLIHKNNFCRDIAIWYDEFLTPGENFNELIERALKNSQLFVLSVTPGVTEKVIGADGKEHDNYVVEKEYPMARAAKKPILPAEMVPTSKAELRSKFEEIPECTDARDSSALYGALLERVSALAIKENDRDLRHNFLIGLAYLSGIDVEVDHERALSLITEAAEGGLEEAMEKLSQMYHNGDGVKRDCQEELKWLCRLADAAEKKFRESLDEYDRERYSKRLFDLGQRFFDLRKLPSAKEAYTRLQELTSEFSEGIGKTERLFDLFVNYRNFGTVSEAEGKLGEAEKYYLCALKTIKKLSIGRTAAEGVSVVLCDLGRVNEGLGRFDKAREYYLRAFKSSKKAAKVYGGTEEFEILSASCKELGDICEREGKLREAKEYFLQAFKIDEKIADESRNASDELDLSISLESLGRIWAAEGKFGTAIGYYERALEIRKDVAEKTGSVEARYALSMIYANIGRIYEAERDLEKAKEHYLCALLVWKDLANETGITDAVHGFSACYNDLGRISKAEGDPDEAEKYHLKALEVAEKLAEECESADARHCVIVCHSSLGSVCQAEGRLEDAKEYFLKMLEESRELYEDTGSVQAQNMLYASYGNLGKVCQGEGDLDGAERYYLAALKIIRRLAKECESVEARRDLSVCCCCLGLIYETKGQPDKAWDHYLDAFEIRKKIAEEADTTEAQSDLVNIYNNLGRISQDGEDFDAAKEYFLSALDICKKLVKKSKAIEFQELLAECFNYLGGAGMADENFSEAEKYFLKALKIRKRIAADIGSLDSYFRLGIAYGSLGFLTGDREYLTAALTIFQELSENCPDMANIRVCADNVAEYLAMLDGEDDF